jgi:MerC mercury resistance protein
LNGKVKLHTGTVNKTKQDFATALLFSIFASLKKVKINWDALGIGASLACAIHCALLPLFLSSLPLFGVNIIHNTSFEIGMIVLAFCIGAYSLYHGYKKHHHSLVPISLFFTGFIFLVLKQFFVQHEVWLLIPAVLLIITAHLINYKSCRVHNHAHADDCDH